MIDTGQATTRWEVAAVEAVIRPRSIAIVGVSTRAGSAGHMVLANLVANEFPGDIHLVRALRHGYRRPRLSRQHR